MRSACWGNGAGAGRLSRPRSARPAADRSGSKRLGSPEMRWAAWLGRNCFGWNGCWRSRVPSLSNRCWTGWPDLSAQYEVGAGGKAVLLGIMRFLTDGRGQYLGSFLHRKVAGLDEQVRRFLYGDGRDSRRLRHLYEDLAGQMEPGLAAGRFFRAPRGGRAGLPGPRRAAAETGDRGEPAHDHGKGRPAAGAAGPRGRHRSLG